ncbi:MAG: hypothetical protein DRQ37_04825 [Gammaproteobacteria bacterium]|nr:MAG: hypothetical protein DRQ37_04825 [Gammaproteobacteria bacterium]
MALKLVIPPISEHPDPKVEIRPVYVEEWIEALPLANPTVFVGKLGEALAALNRSPVKPATRFALLEHYLRPYQFLLELQEKHGSIQSVAAFEKQRMETDATRNVAVELAYGYKIVLAQSIGKKKLWGNDKQVTVSLQRAMLCLGLALVHSCHEYLPTPRNLWKELNELHQYATDRGTAEKGTPHAELRDEFGLSPDHIYKRVMLCSLSDPHHLGYGEIWDVFRILGRCADKATVTAYHSVEKPAGYFVVDPRSDQRPTPYTLVASDAPDTHTKLVDMNPVLTSLKEMQATARQAADSGKTDGDSPSLLARLIRAIELPPKRHSPRDSTEGRVHIAAGISTLHYFLGAHLSDTVLDMRRPQELPGGGAGDEAGAEPSADDEDIQVGLPEDQPPPAAVTSHTYSAEYWDLVNQGPGGIGIIKHIRPNNAIRVGEIIGLQVGSGGDWSVGVVRWLSIANAGEYQAGVQLIANGAEAVGVHASADNGGGERVRSALALPSLTGEKGSTLLAPCGIFRTDTTLTVETKVRPLEIRAGSLIESTGVYDRFSYRLEKDVAAD